MQPVFAGNTLVELLEAHAQMGDEAMPEGEAPEEAAHDDPAQVVRSRITRRASVARAPPTSPPEAVVNVGQSTLESVLAFLAEAKGEAPPGPGSEPEDLAEDTTKAPLPGAGRRSVSASVVDRLSLDGRAY